MRKGRSRDGLRSVRHVVDIYGQWLVYHPFVDSQA